MHSHYTCKLITYQLLYHLLNQLPKGWTAIICFLNNRKITTRAHRAYRCTPCISRWRWIYLAVSTYSNVGIYSPHVHAQGVKPSVLLLLLFCCHSHKIVRSQHLGVIVNGKCCKKILKNLCF